MPTRPSSGVSARQIVVASPCSGGLKYLNWNDQTGNVTENKGRAVVYRQLWRCFASLTMTKSDFWQNFEGLSQGRQPVPDLAALPIRSATGKDAILTQACGATMNEDSKKYTTEAGMLLKTKDRVSRNV